MEYGHGSPQDAGNGHRGSLPYHTGSTPTGPIFWTGTDSFPSRKKRRGITNLRDHSGLVPPLMPIRLYIRQTLEYLQPLDTDSRIARATGALQSWSTQSTGKVPQWPVAASPSYLGSLDNLFEALVLPQPPAETPVRPFLPWLSSSGKHRQASLLVYGPSCRCRTPSILFLS